MFRVFWSRVLDDCTGHDSSMVLKCSEMVSWASLIASSRSGSFRGLCARVRYVGAYNVGGGFFPQFLYEETSLLDTDLVSSALALSSLASRSGRGVGLKLRPRPIASRSSGASCSPVKLVHDIKVLG